MRVLAMIACIVAGCWLAWGQGLEVQTDWSGGPDLFGPVQHWGDRCLTAQGAAWRSIPGQLALTCTPLNPPIQNLIAADADEPFDCAVGDLDGDGSAEVVTCVPVGGWPERLGLIHWWQRQPDGSWVQHLLTDDFYGGERVKVCDMDRDGDLDVLAVAYYGDEDYSPSHNRNGRYAWFENVNGDASAWAQHLAGEMFWGAVDVDAGDLDGDGDIDLVGASQLTDGVYEQDGDITWFENLDGAGTLWEQHELEWDRDAVTVRIADLDGDGDLDVIGAEYQRILWWENVNGDASAWLQRVVSTFNWYAIVDAGDIDNDGDLDLIGGAEILGWWENTAGDGTVWSFHLIADAGVGWIEVRDLDGDGDLDATLTAGLGGYLYWLDNVSGDGYAWDAWLITYNTGGFSLGDVDDDGNLDLAVAREEPTDPTQEVAWYDLSRFIPSGQLVSSVLDGGTGGHWSQIEWNAGQPAGTTLAVLVRASNDLYNLGPFVGVPGSGTDLATLIDPGARYFQYRLDLTTSDNTASPIVHDIAVQQRAIGDLNCDGSVDFADINPFVLALVDPDGYAAQHADCDLLNADINDDGEVGFADINPFVALLTAG
jgi:hypothetical protein